MEGILRSSSSNTFFKNEEPSSSRACELFCAPTPQYLIHCYPQLSLTRRALLALTGCVRFLVWLAKGFPVIIPHYPEFNWLPRSQICLIWNYFPCENFGPGPPTLRDAYKYISILFGNLSLCILMLSCLSLTSHSFYLNIESPLT